VFGKGSIMTCKDIAALSPLYFSGELDAAQGVEFERHLEVCESCSRELRDQMALDARLREAILEEPLESEGLDRRIRQRRVQRPLVSQFWRWTSAGASIAAALVVAWVVFRTSVPGASILADAAEDHRREVVEQEARHWISSQSAIDATALSQGVSPSGIRAPESAGYRLERAKLCRLNGSVYLHLVYSDGAKEFSIFLRHREQEPIAEPASAADRHSQHLAAFRTAALTAVVVTEQPGDAALRLAKVAAHAL
jgi:anti-sigma factor RsiW